MFFEVHQQGGLFLFQFRKRLRFRDAAGALFNHRVEVTAASTFRTWIIDGVGGGVSPQCPLVSTYQGISYHFSLAVQIPCSWNPARDCIPDSFSRSATCRKILCSAKISDRSLWHWSIGTIADLMWKMTHLQVHRKAFDEQRRTKKKKKRNWANRIPDCET